MPCTELVCRLQENDGFLQLHLPALQSLQVSAPYWKTGILHVNQDSFSDAANLTSLSFDYGLTLRFLPEGFTGLSTLNMMMCGLASIPAAVGAALAGSLTHLALPYNDDLQLADADVATLLALRKLQTLDLRKTSLENKLQWSPRSLQHLVELPVAFLANHGHKLALRLLDDDYDSDEDA